MPGQLSADSILQALEKISSSRTFRFAQGQRSFLDYIVREALAGRADRLNERSIGIAVFRKQEPFDPRLDAIVRVEARKLRARLAKYSEAEGQSDRIRFELPVGRYTPVFLTNPTPVTRSSARLDVNAVIATLLQKQNVIRALKAPDGHAPDSAPDLRAYQDYLQGVYYWNRHRSEDLKEAAQFFRKATARDRGFARAYTNLAYAHLMIPVLKAVLPTEFLGKARQAAAKALEVDPLAGEAHIARALPQVQEYQWREAGEEFRKGLELSPSDPYGHAWYGMYLAALGRMPDALREQERAQQLDPASPLTACCYGQTLYLARRHKEAERYFRGALALDPLLPRAHAGLGLASLHQGDLGNAIAELERAQALTRGLGRVNASLGFAYAAAGNRDRAQLILDELLHRFAPAQIPGLMVAEIYIGLGDREKAFQWLDTGIDQKDVTPFLTCDPLFDSLREDSRFSSLLKRTNLA